MTATQLNRFIDATVEPWRNGSGSTRVLFASGPNGHDWPLRVSVADITGSSTFSTFPGIDRYLLTLGPGVLHLNIDGRETELQPYSSRFFDGEAEVKGHPTTTSTHVLNVMFRRDLCNARIALKDFLEPSVVEPPEHEDLKILVALKPATAGDTDLEPLDTLVLTPDSKRVQCAGLYTLVYASPQESRGTE